jgi:hypothetical protein
MMLTVQHNVRYMTENIILREFFSDLNEIFYYHMQIMKSKYERKDPE